VDEAARQRAAASVVEGRVSAAVQDDVMFVGDDGGEVELFVALQDDARAIDRMTVDQRTLGFGQLARFRQDVDRDAHLPDVVEEPGDAVGADLGGRAAEVFGERHRQNRHVQRMRGRVLVEFLELQQREDHAAVAVHRDGERSHDGLRLDERDGAVRANLALQPAHRLGFRSESRWGRS
jgi:hypothetical protein